ncbi:MAG: DUF882 domain-containing protein [Cyanobacteria bacterium REEB459]|nr:DUF882 domain-containing protein [Cyanobacteria bacterium REEB459]
MGTWIKETDEALYLMQGASWIARIQKQPSPSNAKEKAFSIEAMRQWFTRADAPQAMTVSLGTGQPDPQPANQPTTVPVVPDNDGGANSGQNLTGNTSDTDINRHGGIKLKVKSTTYFKLKPQIANQLLETEKVLVAAGKELAVQYYIDAGHGHWQVTLLDPLVDTNNRTWFVYTPDVAAITNVNLTVINDTLFKAAPKLSTQLPQDQKVLVKTGTCYKLLSNTPASGDHLEIELADATLGSKDAKRWFVYRPDVKVEGQRQTLQVTGDTIFKARPVQSSQLADDDKILIKKGTVFLLHSYTNPEANHVKVALAGAFLGPKHLTTWYAYLPDMQILGTELANQPKDNNSVQPANPSDRGMALVLPGFSGTYYSNDPIKPVNQYGDRGKFTWGEALHVNRATGTYRKPASSAVVYGILRVADVLEELRRLYGGKAIRINSWYRDPQTNQAVGGASQSRHMVGDAVDFVVLEGSGYLNPFDVYARLDIWWGHRGGLASSSVFTHIDVRGYRARWRYLY